MSTPELVIHVTEEDGFLFIDLEGNLARGSHEALRERVQALVETDVKGVALGFEAIDFMDSSGMGACAEAAEVLGRLGARPFVTYGMSRFLLRMWAMVGLDRKIPTLATRREALARLKEETA